MFSYSAFVTFFLLNDTSHMDTDARYQILTLLSSKSEYVKKMWNLPDKKNIELIVFTMLETEIARPEQLSTRCPSLSAWILKHSEIFEK